MKASILNRKTNRQTNVKTYFQRLMILMVAIMVSTALVGCDGLNGDDPDNGGTPTGKIDTKIVGKWLTRGTFGDDYHHLHFNKDGTYMYVVSKTLTWGVGVTEVRGKYSTANGRVYFTESKSNLEWNNGIIEPYNLEYSFANHERYKTEVNKTGEYIKMYWVMTSGGLSSEELKEYMQNEFRKEYWRVE